MSWLYFLIQDLHEFDGGAFFFDEGHVDVLVMTGLEEHFFPPDGLVEVFDAEGDVRGRLNERVEFAFELEPDPLDLERALVGVGEPEPKIGRIDHPFLQLASRDANMIEYVHQFGT